MVTQNPNNLTDEQVKAGYSTIPGGFDPVTGKPKATTPTGLNSIAQPATGTPNNLTTEQISQGFSTIPGNFDPVTGKPKTAIPTTGTPTTGIDTSKFTALGITPDELTQLGSPQGMDPNSFTALIGRVQDKLKFNNSLMDQRALIMKHLFDSPLTKEEQKMLPDDVKNVLAQGKDAAELQLRVINDQLQGRSQSLASSIKDLTTGYTATIDAAERAKEKAESNILDYLQLYGKDAVPFLKAKYPEAADTIDNLAGLQTLAEEKEAAKNVNQIEPGDDPQLYSGLTPQTATAVRGQVSAFKTEPGVQNFAVVQEGRNFAGSLDNATKNPADDQALIYALAKALDPGSVVREGEYATAQKYAQSWIQAYGKGVTQALAGTGFLSETARRNIKDTIEAKFQASKKTYNHLADEYAITISSLTGRSDGQKFLKNYSTPEETTTETNIIVAPDGTEIEIID